MTLYVLLPALNEVNALSQLIPAIGESVKDLGPYRIVLVDDGSTDATQTAAQEWSRRWPLEVLRHPANRGYGAALRTGFEWIIANASPTDIVVSLDADNTHRPEYIRALKNKIEEGYEVVTTSYWGAGGEMRGVPFKRRLMSHSINLFFRIALRSRDLRCFTNGFRAYRVSVLQKAAARYQPLIEQTGFPGGAELFIKVYRLGARAAEIPFILHYGNRGGDSKIRLVSTILGYLRLLKTTLL